jgi:hypothetical protein
MSVQTNITLADALGTPVNHVFTASGALVSDQGKTILSVWENRAPVSELGYEILTLESKRPFQNRKSNAKTLKLVMPEIELASGSTTTYVKTRQAVFSGTFTFEPGATAQEKKDIRKMAALALADAGVVGAIESDDQPV